MATDTSDENTSRTGALAAVVHRLGWAPVALATVLAALAAAVVLIVLDDDTETRTDSVLLRPADEVSAGDPLTIPFTRPDGSTTTLADELDRPAVVNFFASWCPPCVSEMPDLQAASEALEGKVTLFGLAVQDIAEDAIGLVERTGITYPWGLDERGDVVASVGALTMPTTVLVDGDGVIQHVHAGELDEATLLGLVDTHLGISP